MYTVFKSPIVVALAISSSVTKTKSGVSKLALEEVLELLELLALLLDFEDFLTELEVALLSEDLEVTDE